MGLRAHRLTGAAEWPRTRGMVLLGAVLLVSGCGWSAGGAAEAGSGSPDDIPAAAQAATVERVVDGDTIWVRVDTDVGPLPPATHKIRLLEIDAPETAGSPAGAQCGGEQATQFAHRHLAVGTEVFLVADVEDQDQYGRYLRYVWTGEGLFFNHAAVRTGRARAVLYEPNDAYIDQLRAAEAQARAASRGIWGEYCPVESSSAVMHNAAT